MSNFLIWFLYAIASYFLLHTILVYGVFENFPIIWKLLVIFRDSFWFLFVIFFWLKNFSITKNYIKKTANFLILLVAFLIIWFFVSHANQKGLGNMVVGIKYSIMFMFIFYSAGLVGYIISAQNKKINRFFSLFTGLVIWVLSLWFLVSSARIMFPDAFQKIWFWPVWDYKADQKPPVYYRTTSLALGWKPRLQWVFSWPNNYSYFLVLILPFCLWFFPKFFEKETKIFKIWKYNLTQGQILWYWFFLLAIFSGLATRSRWFLIWGALAMGIFLAWKISRKYLFWIGWILLVLIGAFSFLKWQSTLEHLESFQKAFGLVFEKPLWYGLWTSWPAIHYWGTILPENTYLQILIDTGIFGFIVWLTWVFYMIFESKKLAAANLEYSKYLWVFLVGFLGLLTEWMFLHVVEDSMVNYLFFVPFGLLFWYNLYQTKNINLEETEQEFEEI